MSAAYQLLVCGLMKTRTHLKGKDKQMSQHAAALAVIGIDIWAIIMVLVVVGWFIFRDHSF